MQTPRIVNFNKSLEGDNARNFLSIYYDYCKETYGFIPSDFNEQVYADFFKWLSQVFDEVVDIPGEEWREIDFEPRRYMISNMGRCKYKQIEKHRYVRIVLKPKSVHNRGRVSGPKRKGRYRLALVDNDGKIKWKDVGPTVWRTFVGPYDSKKQRIRYKDGNRANCTLENLELYSTAKEYVDKVAPYLKGKINLEGK